MDLAVHYSRALEHRHVGTKDSLTIIDPQEIVLQRIIGTLRHTKEAHQGAYMRPAIPYPNTCIESG
jgi:hypothetical protein